MKVGDMIRAKTSDHYGLIVEVRDIGGQPAARVIWQGIACNTSWKFPEDLVFGVENELVSFGGRQ
jgi:hypothetical protein